MLSRLLIASTCVVRAFVRRVLAIVPGLHVFILRHVQIVAICFGRHARIECGVAFTSSEHGRGEGGDEKEDGGLHVWLWEVSWFAGSGCSRRLFKECLVVEYNNRTSVIPQRLYMYIGRIQSLFWGWKAHSRRCMAFTFVLVHRSIPRLS